ncbi:MAG: type II toxin-antitoxin system PemK/MazF family toxin [Candidatus Bipolaricaulia bacterium]
MPLKTPLRRGDIVRVQLSPIVGSEQAGERPALVISPDVINEHSPVILIVPLTSKKTEHVYPFEALIEPPEGGLAQRSKAMLTHLRGVDKRRIREIHGRVSAETMHRVEEALKVATGLIEF